jgi:3-hydroxyisobutyrate dehydrogenase-like beta-hydroxyacid dehydrogenase
MPPIRLTDEELTAVMAAARPIAVDRRDEFLRKVASELGRCGELGDGVVYRVIAQVQREHFEPPDLELRGRWGKYR